MQFPFSLEDFLNVFKKYNESVFPLQIIFYLIAFICVYLLFRRKENSNKFIVSALSFFWLWIGIVYQIIFFSGINKAAYIFGILFIIQGVLFAFYGVIKDAFTFEYQKSIPNYLGIIFIVYALIIYPVLGHLLGHQYPYSPTFGLPCPTTIFTFGILLFTNKKISLLFFTIPFVWSLIGTMAALKLSIYEDYGLLITGLLGFTILMVSNKKDSKTPKAA